jgi:surface protein
MNTIITDSNIYELVDTYLDDPTELPQDLQNIPIGKWDVHRVTSMESLFNNAHDFNEDINDWDVSEVVNMRSMFFGAENFNQPLDKWNVSKVENMGTMFAYCEIFNQPLNSWKLTKVNNMRGMFMGCRSFNQPLNRWRLSSDINDYEMFKYCPISDENKPKIQTVKKMNTRTKPKRLVIENKFKIIPNKMELYDPILMESIDINDFITESKDNIVFIHENHYFPVNKTIIKQQMENKFNIIYECTVPNSINPDYIIKNNAFLNCKSIGLYVDFINTRVMDSILFSNHQIYELVKTDKKFASTVSHDVLYNQGTFVGAAHCQEGTGGYVYDVVKVHKGPKKTRKNIPSIPKNTKSRSSRSKSKNSKLNLLSTRKSKSINKTVRIRSTV